MWMTLSSLLHAHPPPPQWTYLCITRVGDKFTPNPGSTHTNLTQFGQRGSGLTPGFARNTRVCKKQKTHVQGGFVSKAPRLGIPFPPVVGDPHGRPAWGTKRRGEAREGRQAGRQTPVCTARASRLSPPGPRQRRPSAPPCKLSARRREGGWGGGWPDLPPHPSPGQGKEGGEGRGERGGGRKEGREGGGGLVTGG